LIIEPTAIRGAAKLLRVGVVGVGVMGSNHARVFAELPGVQLVGVADPDPQRRELVKSILGCPAVSDLDALLQIGVDALSIAAPTHLHRDLALAAIARGVHVMVEKPIASSVAEGREMIAAARRAGVTLMVGHVERFNPAVRAIKEAIRNEDIFSIAITRVGPFPPRMSNVGIVIDLAVHDIDLIRWFTDSDIVEVQTQLSNAVAEREDIALLQFRTASGVLAHILQSAQCHRRHTRQICHGRSDYARGDRVLRFSTRRVVFHATSVGRLRGALAHGAFGVRHRGSRGQDPRSDRGGGGGESRNRHPLSGSQALGGDASAPGRTPGRRVRPASPARIKNRLWIGCRSGRAAPGRSRPCRLVPGDPRIGQ
jgi:UDP-N-acetylglucosamine 3-dehydrogenase